MRLQGLSAALSQWRRQLIDLPADGGIADAHRAGIRLICPGDSEWPSALDDLEAARPCALWARGASDLRACSHPAVAVIGTRAATAYGVHVATEITADLAACGLTIISGAAYGIDAAAHKAALAVGGLTVAVLACGPDISYPREHAELLQQITARGLIVSEYPPGHRPTRTAFLARNRIIAALAGAGTVVVEAPRVSGALNAARYARRLSRPLMAVPGPVTSAASTGCHELITSGAATCVTCAADVQKTVNFVR
jgi:DNA processing protein